MIKYTKAKSTGTPTRADLESPDPEGARKFYPAIFGWTFHVIERARPLGAHAIFEALDQFDDVSTIAGIICLATLMPNAPVRQK